MDTATTPATSLTLGQAARLTGLGKTTLARAIKRGRLSATRTETGSYSIDAAELARVFPFPAPTEAQDAIGDAPGPLAHHTTVERTNAALAVEVAGLREMLKMMREQNAELKQDRDQWREQAKQLALAPPKPEAVPVLHGAHAEAQPATAWWRFWRRAA